MTNTSYPKGIPYIIGNEAAERYSFYGMKAILYIFLTEFIRNASGELAVFESSLAEMWFHLFVFTAYLMSIFGALLSDIFLGKFKTIMTLSIVYCIGHFVLALYETHIGFLVGCSLIAIGSGGIKPCVSAHVGDQFTSSNSSLIEKTYNWFYLSINFGSVLAYISAEPILRSEYLISKGLNGAVAFGLPGVFMVIATILFYMGKNKYISVPPAGWKVYKEELFSPKGKTLIANLLPIYFFIIFFWACQDQTGSTWVELSKSKFINKEILGISVLPSQLGFLNPLFIMIFALTFPTALYPFLRKKFNMGYITKVTIGFLLTGISFAIISYTQHVVSEQKTISMFYIVLAFIILTAGEMFTSVTVLEFSYTQAPKVMKSFILSFYLLSVAFGNLFTAGFAHFNHLPNGESRLSSVQFFIFFTILVLVAGISFYYVNRNYKEKLIVQDVELKS